MGNCGIGCDSIGSIDRKITDMIFRPPKYSFSLHDFWNDEINTENIESFILSDIHVITINPAQKQHNIRIIFSQGNGSDNYMMLDYLFALSQTLGVVVTTYNYPGYGMSCGTPSEENCYKSHTRVIEHYQGQPEKIILVGQSLGTGVVLDYVSTHKWTQPIMLVSPYLSIPTILGQSYSFVDYLLKHNTFASHRKMSRVTCPVQFVHGLADTLIKPLHTYYLHRQCKTSFPAHYIKDIGHNGILEVIPQSLFDRLIDATN